MHQRNRVGHVEAILRHVRRTSEADPAIERVAEIADPTAGYHGPSDVRTTDGTLVRLGEHRLHGHGNAVPIEQLDNLYRTFDPTGLQFEQRRSHRVLVGQMKPEQVQFVVVEMGTEFDAGDDAHTEIVAGGDRLWQAVDGVVVGEGNGVQLGVARCFHDLRRRKCTVGRGRVDLQIDELRGLAAPRDGLRARYARYSGHVRYPASGERAPGCDVRKRSTSCASPSSASDCSRARVPTGE